MHQHPTQITEVTAESFDTLLDFITKLSEYEHQTPPDKTIQDRLRQDYFATQSKYKAYIANVDGKPAGYITYFFTYSTFVALPTLFLEDIFVLENYRKLGVGKALFNFVKQQAKAAGCGRIDFTVLKWNKMAQDFYHKNDAECLDWHFYRVENNDF